MSATKEYLPLESLGGEVTWPDVVVCAPRWSGRGIAAEEREYLPVVRCRDCKHKHEMASGKLVCMSPALMMHVTTADAFCSDGVRRNK